MVEWETSDIYPYGERRLTMRVLRYWNERRGIRVMPEENDIDPDDLGIDWNSCFLLQARDLANTQDYNFTYLGSVVARAYYDSMLDPYNTILVGPNASCLSQHFQRVIETQGPLVDHGEFPTIHGHPVRYRQVLLPLGDENHGVVAIFGAMSYRILD